MLTPINLNLLPFPTPRVENRVAKVRIFPSHSQINQLKYNQDCIRFVKNALLGAVKVLHFNLHELHGPQHLTDTERFYLSKLDDVKSELERIKNHHRVKFAEKLNIVHKLEDRKKIQDQQEKAEQSWQTYPVILDVMLFNKLLLWLKEEYVFLQTAD